MGTRGQGEDTSVRGWRSEERVRGQGDKGKGGRGSKKSDKTGQPYS
ncbi:hypothetical protein PI95_026100 [Hassallia byssoidea VB512170]|uniref:Uncharacterized protein n=1 Tax=Hassallia byssoidea VB512170 TaxID=1304833 RepID=A0A846HGY0_9CYAN|nr:hypothetical protein [Hassalia byssoidea]NEU75934.1 hypothetical protein [Hassalia byssoidea VB512170]